MRRVVPAAATPARRAHFRVPAVVLVAFVVAAPSARSTTAPDPAPEWISLRSHGSRIEARFFPAAVRNTSTGPRDGVPPAPALLLLPGWPAEAEDVLGLGAALSAQGIHVLLLHPRGHGRSEGEAGHGRTLEDAAAALEWLTAPEGGGARGVDPEGIVVGGYSWGGGMAMAFAAEQSAVRRVLSVAGTDHGVFIRRLDADSAYREALKGYLKSTAAPAGPVRFDVEGTLEELRANQDRFGLQENAARLADRDLFLVAGWDDGAVELELQVLPFYRALRSAGARSLRIAAYPSGHGFRGVEGDLARDIAAWILRN